MISHPSLVYSINEHAFVSDKKRDDFGSLCVMFLFFNIIAMVVFHDNTILYGL